MFAYLFLILSQLTVSFSIVASRHLVKANSIYYILEVRFLLAAIFLFLYAIYAKKTSEIFSVKLSLKGWGLFIFQTLCAGLFFNYFLLTGLKYTSAGTAGIISSFLPSMIVIFSVIFLREKLTSKKTFSLGLATLGLLLVNLRHTAGAHASVSFLGDLLVFCSLIPEAIFYVLSKKTPAHMSNLAISFYMTFINALCFLPFVFFDFTQKAPFSTEFISLGLNALLAVTTVAFYVLWYLGSAKVEASIASLFTAVMPIGALVLAAIFLHEKMYLLQIIGMLFIIIALFVSSWPAACYRGVQKQFKTGSEMS